MFDVAVCFKKFLKMENINIFYLFINITRGCRWFSRITFKDTAKSGGFY